MKYPRPKKAHPWGMPETPFDPASGTFVPTGYSPVVRAFEVQAAGVNALHCKDLRGDTYLVALPWGLRKSSFDTALPSPYVAGEQILAVRVAEGVLVEVEADDFEDTNAGTHEVAYEALPKPSNRVRLQIQSEEADYLVCRAAPKGEDVGETDFYVLKPWHFQRSEWDAGGYTIGGTALTFAYSANGSRTSNNGSDDEVQHTTPSYFQGEIIYAEWLAGPEELDDVTCYLLDANEAGRQWAKEPEEPEE